MRITRRELMHGLGATAMTAPFGGSVFPRLSETAMAEQQDADVRNVINGTEIPRENYSDQPYVVITQDRNWLCVLTTGVGTEGKRGQHVISTISSDRGRTWSVPVDIEPASGPEASWVMPLVVPSGRVYVFYTFNEANLRYDTKSNAPERATRVDTLGTYAFKYSDDNGVTWSSKRYRIPVRQMRIDRENAYGGSVVYFWGVGKPITTRYGAMFGFAKVGKWGNPGTMVTSQSCFMQSPNILHERDPEKIEWTTLPDGEEGLRAPKGPVADEANLVELNDGSLYATYRTIDGFNCHAYSRDGGKTWTAPEYATYSPGGRKIHHPRAANFVKKFSNGKYLLWYHNHGGESVLSRQWDYYAGRNPAWISGGVERNGYIYWSEPEVLLYSTDPKLKMSYPDFVEDAGNVYVTETVKTNARVHRIDRSLLEGLWEQTENNVLCKRGLVLNLTDIPPEGRVLKRMPRLPSLGGGGGFTVDMWIRMSELTENQIIVDSGGTTGRGIAITTTDHYTLQLIVNDGNRRFTWECDPGVHPGTLKTGSWQHIAFVVDGGPKIVTVIVDGVLNDGGPVREYGWGRFQPEMGNVTGDASIKIAPQLFGQVKTLRIYDRYLRTSEVLGNYHAG